MNVDSDNVVVASIAKVRGQDDSGEEVPDQEESEQQESSQESDNSEETK